MATLPLTPFIGPEGTVLDAQEAGRLREEFIAVLGHDLTNPLLSIASAAGFVARGSGRADIGHAARSILSASAHMARLIDDVQDFARGRLGGGLGLDMSDVAAVGPAISDVIQELRDAHPGRLIQDRIGRIAVIRCDVGRLQQLVSNLLGNVLEHGDSEQPVSIDVSVDCGWLVIDVRNAGVAIAPGKSRQGFRALLRPVTSKPAGGLSLGLYICAQIVKEHNGLLEVTSSSDAGTRFTAKIPTAARMTAAQRCYPDLLDHYNQLDC